MITHPAPHAGLGVAQYAWSTSPLRRYVDLVNQWQIASCIEGGPPAAFAPKDADLFAIVSAFDAAYAAYAEYQAKMERYWCLRWLAQEGRTVAEARATREDHAMLVEIPLLIRVPGMIVAGPAAVASTATTVARGQRIEVDVLATDLVDLSVQCRLAAIIEEVDELDPEDESEEGLAAEASTGAADAETAHAESSVEPQPQSA
jgi:exoribonuclease II